MDGDDDLEDHSNALDEVNMKYTVRVDDTFCVSGRIYGEYLCS